MLRLILNKTFFLIHAIVSCVDTYIHRRYTVLEIFEKYGSQNAYSAIPVGGETLSNKSLLETMEDDYSKVGNELHLSRFTNGYPKTR